MSSERPSKSNRIRTIAGYFKGKLSSLLHSSGAPSPSSIEMGSRSDNATSDSPLHVVEVDHATTAFATEACTVPVPILGSAGGRGLETPPTHMSLARSPLSPSLPDDIMQVSTESEQNLSDSSSRLFGNPQSVLIAGGTFVVNNINILPSNTMERQMKIPVLRKPSSSSLFVGRKDVLDKLRKIFIHCADSKLMSRRSCLLWGTGGIGKTQICLRFIEEISDRLAHVFWVDASSEESITMSLRGISSIFAAQAACLDDSVDSVLQWISDIQEEWLIVFDNADAPPVYVVENFIPSGNKGNILITSRNRSMGRIVSSQNIIEINVMEEGNAITLLLEASRLDASAEHTEIARNIVTELGCMPFAVDQAGAYIEAGRCSIDRYLQHLSLHRQTLMSDATFRGASRDLVDNLVLEKH